jgi:uncharacterized zinc-type alcohol dehydrogenase-like protein
MPSSKGYAALDAQSALAPFSFARREPGATEIVIEILYCGVCHSDLHMAATSGAARPIRWFRGTRLWGVLRLPAAQ